MRILFVCHRLPFPPKRGGKIRPFNIIRHFHEQGHQVTVGSLARSPEELEEGTGLRDYCNKVLIGSIGKYSATAQMIARLPSTSPSSMGYFYSAALHRLILAEVTSEKYDLVFVHCSSVAQYLATARDIPSIMDFGDMDSHKLLDYSSFKPQPLALGYWLEGTKLRRAEKRIAKQFDVCTCTTKAELGVLNGMGAAKRTSWFPNGVDTEFFSPDGGPYDPDEICFIGRMDYFPNQQGMLNFCNLVLPLILKQRPQTKLTIVGASPSAEIVALGSLPGVTVTGTVDDVRPFVRKAVLTIAPLAIAHGTQNKILESMAMGAPVVSSDTAAGGVDAIPEEHILIADDSESFSRQILRIVNSSEERQRLSDSARERVITHHNWHASMNKLDGIVSSLLNGRR